MPIIDLSRFQGTENFYKARNKYKLLHVEEIEGRGLSDIVNCACVIEAKNENLLYITPAGYSQNDTSNGIKLGINRQQIYRDLYSNARYLNDSKQYWLQTEPTNKFDNKAVFIKCSVPTKIEFNLRYIPRPINDIIFDLIKNKERQRIFLEYIAEDIDGKFIVPVFAWKIKETTTHDTKTQKEFKRFISLLENYD